MNDYEKEHLELLRKHLAECTVLLKKDGSFPLAEPCEIAAYGSGGVFLGYDIQPARAGEARYTLPENTETVRAFLVDGAWSPLAPCAEMP